MTHLMTRLITASAAFGISLLALTPASHAQGRDCTRTSVGRTPINDLGTGLYLGQYQGGLYPNGLNTPPLSLISALPAFI